MNTLTLEQAPLKIYLQKNQLKSHDQIRQTKIQVNSDRYIVLLADTSTSSIPAAQRKLDMQLVNSKKLGSPMRSQD